MDELSYRERLAQDVAAWQRDALISEAQARSILARAGAAEPRIVGALRLGWLVTAVAIVAAIVLGAGIVLLFAANWGGIPPSLRVGVLVGGILASYAAGYALTYRFAMERIGSALLLLGVIIFGASVFLVARMYGMPADSPSLILLAAVGTLPLAYLFSSRIVLLMGIGGAVAWIIALMSKWYPDSPKSESAALVLAAVAVALYVAGHWHRLRPGLRAFGDVYAIAALLMMLGLAYGLTFSDVWQSAIDARGGSAGAPPAVYVAIGIAAALIAAQLALLPRDTTAKAESAVEGGLLVVAAIAATWPAWAGWSIVFNGVFFALAAGLVVRGYLLGERRYVDLGLAALALGLLTRYVDVFWSQIATSAFFIIGGLLLFAVAIGAERLRRALLQDRGASAGGTAAGGQEATPA